MPTWVTAIMAIGNDVSFWLGALIAPVVAIIWGTKEAITYMKADGVNKADAKANLEKIGIGLIIVESISWGVWYILGKMGINNQTVMELIDVFNNLI